MILQTKTFGVWEYLLYEGYWGLLDVFDIKLIDAAVIFLEQEGRSEGLGKLPIISLPYLLLENTGNTPDYIYEMSKFGTITSRRMITGGDSRYAPPG